MQGSRKSSTSSAVGTTLEDDMAEGDLGDGLGNRSGATAASSVKNHVFSGLKERLGGVSFGWTSSPDMNTSLKLGTDGECWRLARAGSPDEISKEELRERLLEATKETEMLHCELEVARRYMEGKYEALKILQGQAIHDKATTHTKSLLQKSEERAKALEKEVNALQWELTFSQVQMKKFQESWEQKFNRVYSENTTLSNSLEERMREVRELKEETAALSQQCLELLSMLSVKEQRAFQATNPLATQGTFLELAVLGACQCLGTAQPCPCAKTAAATRKQILQLRQELDTQRNCRDEAWMVADAFRIAFEQQLRKRSDHFLLRAEAHTPKSRPHKSEGAIRNSANVVQRLREILPSSLEVKLSDDPIDTVYRLLDLLNDKEEALAHQRKVSLMLAHNAEELERQLHLESNCQLQKLLEAKVHSRKLSNSNIQQVEPSSSNSHSLVPTHSTMQHQESLHDDIMSHRQSSTDTQKHELTCAKVQSEEQTETSIEQQEPVDSKVQSEEQTETSIEQQEPVDSKVQSEEQTETSIEQREPVDAKVQSEEQPETSIEQWEPVDSKVQSEEPTVSKIQVQQASIMNTCTHEPSEVTIQSQEQSGTRDTKTYKPSDNVIQLQVPLESKMPSQEPSNTDVQPEDPSQSNTKSGEPFNTSIQPEEPSQSNTKSGEPFNTSIQPEEPLVCNIKLGAASNTKILRQKRSNSKMQSEDLPNIVLPCCYSMVAHLATLKD